MRRRFGRASSGVADPEVTGGPHPVSSTPMFRASKTNSVFGAEFVESAALFANV
jgi:hypothetical protein